MGVTTAMCTSFKGELLGGTHDLDTNTITVTKTQETSTLRLLSCVKSYLNGKLNIENNPAITQNCNIRNIDNVFKELYKRHIIPFYIPLLIIIALIHIINPKEKVNYTRYRIYIFLAGLFLIIFSETTLRFVNIEIFKNIKIIIIPLILFFILYTVFFNYLKFKHSVEKK